MFVMIVNDVCPLQIPFSKQYNIFRSVSVHLFAYDNFRYFSMLNFQQTYLQTLLRRNKSI